MIKLAGAYPPFTPAPSPPTDPFTYQTPGYVTLVDGMGGFGMNHGGGFRPADGSLPQWYFITTNSSNVATGTLVDTRTWECSLPFAAAQTTDASGNPITGKVIIDLTSGQKDYRDVGIVMRGDNVSMFGFGVRPDYGGYIRSNWAMYVVGNRVHIEGFRFMQDSSGASPLGDQRDNVTFGAFSPSPFSGYHVVSGCEFFGGIDESLSFYDSSIVCSVMESAICAPMEGTAISEAQSHNYGTISGYNATSFSMQRCFHAHCGGRTPLSYTKNTGIANCLVYNSADGRGNLANNIQIATHTSDPSPSAHYASIVSSVFLAGPQAYVGGNYPINAENNQAGTQIYVSNLVQRGHSLVTTQDTFLCGSSRPASDARQWYVTSPPSGSMPGSWGASHQNIDQVTDSTAGILAFITKLRACVGVQPKTSGISKLSGYFTQAENYVNGTGSGYGAVEQSINYPSATEFTIIPSNSSHVSSYWGGNAMPSVGTRDVINSDGISAGEVWKRAVRRVHYGT